MRHTLFAALASALTIAIGCGDPKPDPATPASSSGGTAPADTAPASSSSAAPVASSPPPPATDTAPPVATTPPAAADAGAAPPPAKAPVVIGETKDECTPVGVDFEKRARPKLKECYAEGKKKDANLQGTVKIKVTVDVKGKIKSTKITEKTLPDPVAECMLKVVKSTPFPEVDKCWDSTILLPITFPTPR